MSCIEDKENTDPHSTKKRKLSLSLKNRDRFKAITEEKLDTMSKPQVPKNTEKSSRWAMTNLREWYDDYNDRNSSAKCFCLRGGGEHRDLCISQLQRLRNPDRYVYSEKSSKNRQGGLLQSRLDHKTVTITTSPSAGNRCHVFILDN